MGKLKGQKIALCVVPNFSRVDFQDALFSGQKANYLPFATKDRKEFILTLTQIKLSQDAGASVYHIFDICGYLYDSSKIIEGSEPNERIYVEIKRLDLLTRTTREFIIIDVL